jgi:predicted PurR-regulated permease PerM
VDEPVASIFGLGTRERRWLILFLVLGSAYFALLLVERLLSVVGGFSSILLILFLAWLLAFVMSPLVAAIERGTGLPRPAVVGLTYFVALVALGFVLFYTGSAISQQVGELAAEYPRDAEPRVLATLADWQRSLQLGRLEIDLVELYESSVAEVETIGGAVFSQAQAVAGVTVAALGSLLLIIILSLYMLMDSERILGRLKALVPRRYGDEADIFERSIARAFGGFLRAQLILAAVQAVLVGVVGGIFGIPYLFLVGTLSALAMLIPFFGPPLALIPPIVAAAIFTDALLPVAVILLVVQTVLVNWFQPRLMRDALGLHPILVLVGLLLGAQVAGVWGALFGIPVIAVLFVFASYVLFRAVPNVALPETERLSHVQEHTLVSVEKEQVGDETHPHIHVTRSRRPDGSEQFDLRVDEPADPAPRRTDVEDAPAP